MKTFFAKEHEVEKQWFLVNADNKPLGRIATEIAIEVERET